MYGIRTGTKGSYSKYFISSGWGFKCTGGNSENVKWSSDNEKVATVVNGMVTPVSGGKAVITATTKDGYFVTFSVNVLVKPTVAFGFNKAEVVEGTAVDVAVKIAPEYANVTYEVELDGQTANTSTYMLAENGDSITFTPLVNGNFYSKGKSYS